MRLSAPMHSRYSSNKASRSVVGDHPRDLLEPGGRLKGKEKRRLPHKRLDRLDGPAIYF
jgi:hypothetical protein